MTNKSKNIGTAGETAVVKYLIERGYPLAERLALRGALDIGDVRWTQGCHIEVKAGNMAHSASWRQCVAWVYEAEREAENAGVPCYLIVKRKGTGNVGNWRLFCFLSAVGGYADKLSIIEMPVDDALRLAAAGRLEGIVGDDIEKTTRSL